MKETEEPRTCSLCHDDISEDETAWVIYPCMFCDECVNYRAFDVIKAVSYCE